MPLLEKRLYNEYFYDKAIKDRLISRSDGTIITYDTNGFMGNPTNCY